MKLALFLLLGLSTATAKKGLPNVVKVLTEGQESCPCSAHFSPVRCLSDGLLYANQCAADCRSATGCAPAPQDGGGLSCGGGPDEPCRRRAWAGILPHQRALLCPLHAPAPPLEQIPEEALEILKDGIETDLPLRCAQALQFHLRDVTACPYAICDIRRYGDKGEVIGTEWRTLRGRYKWSVASASLRLYIHLR